MQEKIKDDTISRAAAIDILSLGKEILSRVLDDMDVVGTEREKYSWGLRLIESNIEDIEELPSVQPQRWIPCSERLPEEDTDILVTYVDGEETRIIPVNYGRGTWFDCIFDRALDSLNVIAWMPLPESYAERRSE